MPMADGADERAARHSRSALLLTLSLISVEFLAGMQSYLSQTVLPLAAAELHGESLYGPVNAAAQAPMFFMLPLGAWLLSRYRVGHLMLVFTVVTVAGAALCATALSMAVFILGTRSEEHTSELQSRGHLVCRLLLEKKKMASDQAEGLWYRRRSNRKGTRRPFSLRT